MSDAATVQIQGLESAWKFMELSAGAATAQEAADWSLAARNATQVSVACEQILKHRDGGGE